MMMMHQNRFRLLLQSDDTNTIHELTENGIICIQASLRTVKNTAMQAMTQSDNRLPKYPSALMLSQKTLASLPLTLIIHLTHNPSYPSHTSSPSS